ncbi:MAG TPA: serine hydrolase, partial [Vicinamibacterales bacterium]|nr:serine hydrolase [Vicinamibacterales bacterium]
MTSLNRFIVSALFVLAYAAAAVAQELPASLVARIGESVEQVRAATGVPSASIAVVQDGRIVYTQAFGAANLETDRPARPEMRYSVG